MSLHLGDIFNQNARLQTQAGTSSAAAGRMSSGQGKTADSLSLPIGATVSGTVEKIEGDFAYIRMNGNEIVQARLENAFSLEQGANVAFQVSAVADGQIILKSLFQNMAMQATAEKALQQAGISVNANSLGMVQAMMENGMAIDKTALQAMYQDVVHYPQLGGADMVSMHQLKLPVNEKNVTQFQAYLNLEHQISAGVSQMTDSLMASYGELSALDPQKAFGMMIQLLDTLAETMDEESFAKLSGDTDAALQAVIAGKDAQGTISGEKLPADGQGENISDGKKINGNSAQMAAVAQTPAAAQTAENGEKVSDRQQTSYLEALRRIALLQQEMETDSSSSPGKNQVSDSPDGQGNVSEQGGISGTGAPESPGNLPGLGSLGRELQEFGMSEDAVRQFASGELSGKELLAFLKTMALQAKEAGNQELLSKLDNLFQRKAFQQLVRNEIGRQLLMQPQTVSEKAEVEAYYARLLEQTDKLLGKLSDFLPQNHQTMQELTNIRDNLDFMNQLNQTMSYVQLPLKLSGGNAHGDLYVYTNKKSLAQSDGSVSAYLHLDMDHLGPVDVYVAMQGQKVSTNFYLRDDEMIDFVSAHIDQLDDRLAQKGYQMQANITKKESTGQGGVMQEIVEDHKGQLLIGSQSFDVRA